MTSSSDHMSTLTGMFQLATSTDTSTNEARNKRYIIVSNVKIVSVTKFLSETSCRNEYTLGILLMINY